VRTGWGHSRRAAQHAGRIRVGQARDGQGEQQAGRATGEVRVTGGSEQHGQKRRGGVWHAASGQTDARVEA